ncbi:MAG: hypothetical protein RI958_431, partial [Actinomycetota bacterium]
MLQVLLHEGLSAGVLGEIARAAVPVAVATALVLALLDLIWPGVRRALGLKGASETAGSVLALGIGVAVATMVLSWAHGVIAGTSADHSGLVSAGHHGMSAF